MQRCMSLPPAVSGNSTVVSRYRDMEKVYTVLPSVQFRYPDLAVCIIHWTSTSNTKTSIEQTLGHIISSSLHRFDCHHGLIIEAVVTVEGDTT